VVFLAVLAMTLLADEIRDGLDCRSHIVEP
jgi:hypothetical protein